MVCGGCVGRVVSGPGDELGGFVTGGGGLGLAVGGWLVIGAPRLNMTAPIGGSFVTSDFLAMKYNLKVPLDICVFHGIFFIVYTLSPWLSTISARQISKFGVGTGKDKVKVHPEVTSSVRSRVINPLNPSYHLSTTTVLACSPYALGA